MENHAGSEVGTMFEVSVLKSRTPPDEVAFFVIILLNLLALGVAELKTVNQAKTLIEVQSLI
jgi:hypothetical protein